MFAVRSIFADPPRIAREMRALAEKGLVEKSLGETDDPLGFLIHEGGAASMTEAAYRYVRHEPGVDVVLFGTGDAGICVRMSRRSTSRRCRRPTGRSSPNCSGIWPWALASTAMGEGDGRSSGADSPRRR